MSEQAVEYQVDTLIAKAKDELEQQIDDLVYAFERAHEALRVESIEVDEGWRLNGRDVKQPRGVTVNMRLR